MGHMNKQDNPGAGADEKLTQLAVALCEPATTAREQLRIATAMCIHAMRGDRKLIGKASLKTLRKKMPTWPGRVQREILVFLGEVRDEEAVGLLTEALEHPDARAQTTAVDSLCRIGGKAAQDAITRFAEEGSVGQVRRHAGKALLCLKRDADELAESSLARGPAPVRDRSPMRNRQSPVRGRSRPDSQEEREEIARSASETLQKMAREDNSARIREYITEVLGEE